MNTSHEHNGATAGPHVPSRSLAPPAKTLRFLAHLPAPTPHGSNPTLAALEIPPPNPASQSHHGQSSPGNYPLADVPGKPSRLSGILAVSRVSSSAPAPPPFWPSLSRLLDARKTAGHAESREVGESVDTRVSGRVSELTPRRRVDQGFFRPISYVGIPRGRRQRLADAIRTFTPFPCPAL